MKTEINIYVVLIILTIHWFADFVLQTDKQAKGKSKNWSDLLDHTFNYSAIFLVISFFCAAYCGLTILWFAPVTFICHTITDFYTSRVNSKLYEEGKNHEFFVSIGFDQLLHFAQLMITYQLLSK